MIAIATAAAMTAPTTATAATTAATTTATDGTATTTRRRASARSASRRRPSRARSSTTRSTSGTEIVRPALDESDDRFEAALRAVAGDPRRRRETPEAKKAATPEADARVGVQQAPPSAPTKSKTPVRIARGVGGDELAIDWNDDKPKKKPPSALARRLARGERPSKSKSKSKRAPKREAPPPADTPLAADDHEESTEDVIATLAKERERLARKASVQGARDEAEKAAKKKAKEEKRRRKAEKKARKEKAAAPDNEIKSLFANAIKPDANFVEDDWDASPAKPAPRASGPIGGFGAVKPDANFVEDDWDAGSARCRPGARGQRPRTPRPTHITRRRQLRTRRRVLLPPARPSRRSPTPSEESSRPLDVRDGAPRPARARRRRGSAAAHVPLGRRHGVPPWMLRLDLPRDVRVRARRASRSARTRLVDAVPRPDAVLDAPVRARAVDGPRCAALLHVRGAPSVACAPPRITPRQSMSYAVCVSTRRRVASASRAAAAASFTSRRRRARSAASAPRARSSARASRASGTPPSRRTTRRAPCGTCAPSAPRRPRRSRLAPRRPRAPRGRQLPSVIAAPTCTSVPSPPTCLARAARRRRPTPPR